MRPAFPSAGSAILVVLALLASGCGGHGFALWRTGTTLPGGMAGAHSIQLRLQAGADLNADDQGRPLALALRLYQLRQKDTFEALPQAVFLDPQRKRELLGSDLISVREIMLTPGQHHQASEVLAPGAVYIGVVALYHAPATGRWRTAVPAAEVLRNGLTIGLSACAMVTSSGISQIGSVRCRHERLAALARQVLEAP